MTHDEMRRLVAAHMDAEARHDAVAAASYYVDDGYYEVTALGLRFDGRAAVAMQYAASDAAMPDSRVTMDGEVIDGDRLVHWGTFHGSVTGALLGQNPTGRTVALPFIAIIEFAGGRLRGERLYYDLATLCDQAGIKLGAVREAAGAMQAALASSAAA
ncbi:MAG: ester cyclase [Candidatus Binatia bacterium]